MISEELRTLVRVRVDQAHSALSSAELLLREELPRDSINRSYYAMFYAVLALLIPRQLGTSKHQGAISLFDREFVRTGELAKEMSKALHYAFDLRLESDYAERTAASGVEAALVLEQAQDFVSKAEAYLREKDCLPT